MPAVIIMFCIFIGTVWCKDPDLFEGDIVLTNATKEIMKGDPVNRDSISDRNLHWPNGVVPYVFAHNFDFNRRHIVAQAINRYKLNTCIKFKPRTSEINYIRFIVGDGCFSYIGKRGGMQDVSIGNGCNKIGIVIHELMHAVGFFHEQSRRDRDDHVKIHWNNIPPKVISNFQKYSHGEGDYLGTAYDLDSVMHYPRTAFGIGGKATITAKNNYHRQLGTDHSFSWTDLKQLNIMYKCNRAAPPASMPSDHKPKNKDTPSVMLLLWPPGAKKGAVQLKKSKPE